MNFEESDASTFTTIANWARVVGEVADNVSDCNLSDIMSFGTSGANDIMNKR